jgi:hypothetical protein
VIHDCRIDHEIGLLFTELRRQIELERPQHLVRAVSANAEIFRAPPCLQ